MGFWLFILACSLLIPLTMLGFGRYFKKAAAPGPSTCCLDIAPPCPPKPRDLGICPPIFRKAVVSPGSGTSAGLACRASRSCRAQRRNPFPRLWDFNRCAALFLLLPVAFTESPSDAPLTKTGQEIKARILNVIWQTRQQKPAEEKYSPPVFRFSCFCIVLIAL